MGIMKFDSGGQVSCVGRVRSYIGGQQVFFKSRMFAHGGSFM
jgi:hypothetical protein